MVSRQNVKSGAARRVARVAMLLVKLGGSVLTDKTRLRTARRAAIRRLASELAAVRQSLVVVHGAGSYGHILARRHKLNQGGVSVTKRIAASRVQQDVKELDGLVVNALLHVGIAAIPIAPRSEEHTSELQSLRHLVCRLLLEKKKQTMESNL